MKKSKNQPAGTVVQMPQSPKPSSSSPTKDTSSSAGRISNLGAYAHKAKRKPKG